MATSKHCIPLIGVLAICLLPACGSGEPRCGDGVVDDGEQCDNDTEFCCDCVVCLPPTATIRWELNPSPVPGFDTDGCIDLGISRVEVEVVGPTNSVLDESCSLRQVVFSDLPNGVYTAHVRPLDADGNLLTHEDVTQGFQTGVNGVDITVGIPPEAWIGPYTGSYFFQTTWNGLDCAGATPEVVEQRITMTQNGQEVPLMTSEGGTLDGPCQESAVTQSAVEVPFGYATLRIEGLDSGAVVQYDQEFETFVGAGASNTTYLFDITTPQPDAGMIDAGAIDANAIDASMIDASMIDAAM